MGGQVQWSNCVLEGVESSRRQSHALHPCSYAVYRANETNALFRIRRVLNAHNRKIIISWNCHTPLTHPQALYRITQFDALHPQLVKHKKPAVAPLPTRMCVIRHICMPTVRYAGQSCETFMSQAASGGGILVDTLVYLPQVCGRSYTLSG